MSTAATSKRPCSRPRGRARSARAAGPGSTSRRGARAASRSGGTRSGSPARSSSASTSSSRSSARTSGRSTRTSSSRLRLQDPSWAHPMGTDELGRDTLARIIHGAQVSLQVGVISVSHRARPRALDRPARRASSAARSTRVLMRLVDLMFALPGLVLAIVIAGLLGPNRRNAMIAIGIVIAPAFARVVRGSVLEVMGFPFVESARALGSSHCRVMGRHVIPNIAAPVIVLVTVYLSTAILSEAALSFLGLGTQPPEASWGGMLSSAALLPRGRPVAVDLPRARDHDRRARLQLPRGRAARHPRSAARSARRRGQRQEVTSGASLDVLIKGGWVADGTGSPPFLGDVAIEDGRIVEVGRLDGAANAARVIDASGKVVCPGFVDPHSHSDFSLLANPTAESTIRQGVTTEVVGQLRLELCARSRTHSRVVQTERAAHVRLRRAADPVERRSASTSTSSRRSATAPTSPGSSATTRSASRPASPGHGPPTSRRRDGRVHARGDGGGRARDVDRARVQPGPRGDGRRARSG